MFTQAVLTLYRFQPARRQPDNREQIQQGGDSESCMAVLNNFYGDGECSRCSVHGNKSPQESSGTTWPATTRSRSSARTWRAISSLPDRPSPISASPEGICNLQSSLCCYLLFVLFMTLLIIQQWKADQVGTIPKYDKGKYTFSKSLKTLIKVEYIQILNMANKTNI